MAFRYTSTGEAMPKTFSLVSGALSNGVTLQPDVEFNV